MSASTPAGIHAEFARAFFAQDLEGVLALYDPDAVMVPAPDAAPVRGIDAIRGGVEALLALRPRDGEIRTVYAIEQDGLALLRSRWRFTVTLPDGQVTAMAGSGIEIAKRRPDGSWVQVLDNPWGADGGSNS